MATREKNGGLLIGSHMSIAGGVHLAAPKAASLGATAMQIFVKNNNRWTSPPISPEAIRAFPKSLEEAGLSPAAVFAHTCYLINLASPKPEVSERSVEALIDEVRRCRQIGVPSLVMHPGAHLGVGREKGIAQIAKLTRQVIRRTKTAPVRILFETTAGMGSSIGSRFEDLRDILLAVDDPERTGVCLDTCHIFAAGYDIRTPKAYMETMDLFDEIVGIAKLHAIHLNDSKKDLGEKRDRHAHIGEGCIGKAGFGLLLNDLRLRHLPMVLETPKDKELTEDRMNLDTLRDLIKRRGKRPGRRSPRRRSTTGGNR